MVKGLGTQMITSLIVALITTWLFAIFYPASTTPSTIIIFFVSYCAGIVSEIYNDVKDIKKMDKAILDFIAKSIIEIVNKDKEDKNE
jgi:hypothetical protein